MPEKKQSMSRDEAVLRLVGLFQQYGYEGATLTRIAEATGLGRASLYHHFPKGKEEMAQAVLEHVNRWMNSHILEPLRQEGSVDDRLHIMSNTINQLYNQGRSPCLLAVLSLGDSHDLFHTQVQKALTLWIETLVQVLSDIGIEPAQARIRAEDAILQIQGALVLARGLNDTAAFKRVLERLPDQLTQL